MAATIGTRISTFLTGRMVGKDAFGNRYFEARRGTIANGLRKKRWVMYKGMAEPSKVPAEWHGWLHYTHEAPITHSKRAWQKEHLPNLTGTKGRHLPKGHLLRGGNRAAATADYQPWTPE